MRQKNNIKIFIDEIFSPSSRKTTETNTKLYNQSQDNWLIDLLDMLDCGNSNNRRYRYIKVMIDVFSRKCLAHLFDKCIQSKATSQNF